jgi:anti-anti-sigma factor
MQQEDLQIKETIEDDIHLIKAIGDLIITNAEALQKRIDKALDEGAINITLDFLEIQYIDSFGIGVIVKTKADVDKKRGRLRVMLNDSLYSLFQKCHLDEYIDLETPGKSDDEDI